MVIMAEFYNLNIRSLQNQNNNEITKSNINALILISFQKQMHKLLISPFDKQIKATGGKEAWKKVNTIKQQPIIDFCGQGST